VQAQNVLNSHKGVAYYEVPNAAGLISHSRASRFSGDPQVDWNKVMTPYNYTDALNGAGAFSGAAAQAPLTLYSRYGLAQTFQQNRNLRLSLRFTF